MAYRTSDERFEAIAAEAVGSIPKKFRKLLKNVSIIIEDYPDEETVSETGIPRDRLMGLFRGVAFEERDSFFAIPSPYPESIFLYRKNIEASCHSEDDLREEIRKTVLHEVGHYFGMTEEDLEDFENS